MRLRCQLRETELIRRNYLKLLSLCLILTLPGCAVYKTREFIQIDTPRFESWNIAATVKAFSGSSGASLDNHNFSVIGDVTRYPENTDTDYVAKAVDMTLYAGACGSPDIIDIKPLRFKHFGKSQQGRSYVAADNRVLIAPEIDKICMRVTAAFNGSTGEEALTKTFDVNMKRNEKSMPGPVLD